MANGGAGSNAQSQAGPWAHSALSTSEAISSLGGQTVKGKSFIQSFHKTETKRNIQNGNTDLYGLIPKGKGKGRDSGREMYRVRRNFGLH